MTNSNLGKIIDGRLITPTENEKRKLIIANPTDEQLKFVMGYKDVVVDDKPNYDEATQYLSPLYTETDDVITVHWDIKGIEEESYE